MQSIILGEPLIIQPLLTIIILFLLSLSVFFIALFIALFREDEIAIIEQPSRIIVIISLLTAIALLLFDTAPLWTQIILLIGIFLLSLKVRSELLFSLLLPVLIWVSFGQLIHLDTTMTLSIATVLLLGSSASGTLVTVTEWRLRDGKKRRAKKSVFLSKTLKSTALFFLIGLAVTIILQLSIILSK